MAEIQIDASIRRFTTAATLIVCAAVVGIPYWCDRAYRRWLKENDPLAGPKARLDRLGTDYQEKRANATEVAQLISTVLAEVAWVTSTERAP